MARCTPRCSLRHSISIQQESRVADGGGGSTLSWTNVATGISAAIEPLRGGERLRAMQLEDSITHKVTIRYRAGVTAAMRILFGARVFNIRAVINPGERDRWLEIMAEEGVAV